MSKGLTKAKKIRISACSVPLLQELHEHVTRYNVQGSASKFRDIASDCFDGAYLRSELRDLIKRRLLTVVYHGFDDSMGSDPLRAYDPRLCGTNWSVDPTERLVNALWPRRCTESGRLALAENEERTP